MTDFDSRTPPKRVRSHRACWRTIIFTVCAASIFTVCIAFVLTGLIFGYAITLFATTLLKGLGDFGVAVVAEIVFTMLLTIPWLLELFNLLTTGQLIPFVMRLFQLLNSS